jgi:hypothetical protein
VDFDGMTHASAKVLGEIIMARLVEAEREREAARDDAVTFTFMVRELPDTEPPPPVFYDLVALMNNTKQAAA